MSKVEFYVADEYGTESKFTSIDLPGADTQFLVNESSFPALDYLSMLEAYEPEIVYFEQDDPICGMREFGKYDIYEKAAKEIFEWYSQQEGLNINVRWAN